MPVGLYGGVISLASQTILNYLEAMTKVQETTDANNYDQPTLVPLSNTGQHNGGMSFFHHPGHMWNLRFSK